MRWRGGRRSTNVDDRRGMGTPVGMRLPRGGGFRIPMGGGGRRAGMGGIGGLVVVVVLLLLFGGDLGSFLPGDTGGTGRVSTQQTGGPRSAAEDELADFVSVVLADTEDTWKEIFRENGATYQEPRLVLFTGAVESACGFAEAAVGPFYCPADRQVYIDLGFYRDLQQRFGAGGDFAQAYVVAHEIGHHVQNLLGISEQVERARAGMGEGEANALSVEFELQGDCFAGVWANHANQRQLLEAGDVEEALNAASAIGDDRLQMQSRGYVTPDSFTHGSSKQRVRWFRQGLQSGDLSACNTFEAATL